MKKVIIFLLLSISLSGNGHAAIWVKLNENSHSKLMLDKQSVLQQDAFKKAWVKVEYRTPQKNLQTVGTEYTLSKLLWFFDCTTQKSATSQVFQYLGNELVYSAGVDPKNSEFIEPVPESDVDITMRYVCSANKPASTPVESKPVAEKAGTPAVKPEKSDKEKTETKVETVAEKPGPAAKPVTASAAQPDKQGAANAEAHKTHWTYEGKQGPDNWAKLSPEFATCETGRNQSPINIENAMRASLKPLKGIQKFPAKDIINNGHTVQVNFKQGNMLVLDSAPYQMKQVHFHAPSENTINGKSFPLEAHFVHADAKGNLTVIGVMFKEGEASPGLEKLWAQLPDKEGAPVSLKSRVIPSELIPENRAYYRFSGSLTTPPCSEGVRWLMMKTPMMASKAQIEAFERAVKHHNNRPVQALNGRVIVE